MLETIGFFHTHMHTHTNKHTRAAFCRILLHFVVSCCTKASMFESLFSADCSPSPCHPKVMAVTLVREISRCDQRRKTSNIDQFRSVSEQKICATAEMEDSERVQGTHHAVTEVGLLKHMLHLLIPHRSVFSDQGGKHKPPSSLRRLFADLKPGRFVGLVEPCCTPEQQTLSTCPPCPLTKSLLCAHLAGKNRASPIRQDNYR